MKPDFFIQGCILAVAFLLPLWLDGATFFLLVGTGIWLVQKVRHQVTFKQKPLNKAIGLLIALSALSIAVSPDKPFSIYNYLHLMGRYMLLYGLIVQTVETKEELRRIFLALFLGTAVVCGYGFYQYAAPMDISGQDWVDQEQFPELKKRVFSTLENPNLLAGYLVILLPLVFGAFLNEKSKITKKAFALLLGAVFVCLILTFSRGAWLTLPFMIFVLGLVHERRWLWLLLLLPLGLLFQEGVLERLTSIFNPTDTSSMMRLALWQSTITMISDHPWLGIGWGVYYQVYPLYDFFVQGETIVCHAHNLYLNIAAEIGLPGLFTFLYLYLSFIRQAYKAYKQEPKSSIGGLMLGLTTAYTALAVMSLTDHVLFNIQLSMLFWLLNGCAVISLKTLSK